MADEQRMVCIAIAVADAVRNKFLSGALNGAKLIHEWARALDYESTLITDAESPVTITKLREQLEEALWPSTVDPAGRRAPPPTTDRLIVYFAGHGLLRGAEEALWLLSDWERGRAVGMEALRKALHRYPITHLAIISDACLSLPADMNQAELEPDPVLYRGPTPRSPPWYDRFVATQEGTTTFMVPGNDPEDDRCVFSGVLLEGLWGLNEAAFSKRQPDAVTGNSLSVFLKTEVQRVSAIYSDPRVPSVGATFPEGEDIYFERNPRLQRPAFPQWPDKTVLLGMGVGRPRSDVTDELAFPVGPSGASEIKLAGDDKPILIQEWIASGDLLAMPRRHKKRLRTFPDLSHQLDTPLPKGFPFGPGLAAFGAAVRAIWHAPKIAFTQYGQSPWWTVQLSVTPDHWMPQPAPVLIEFADGRFVATVVSHDMITRVARDGHGASAILMPELAGSGQTRLARQAMLAMEQGALHAEKAVNLAVLLRQYKHADPVLGVISAYLYDTMGDVESIRRMAYYYLSRGQSIPYDIALLGLLHGWERNGQLWASVPPVPERKPRNALEAKRDWTHVATPGIDGYVGGNWPWMRQGWVFLEDPTDEESTLIAPELLNAMPYLTSGRFATFERRGAIILAHRFGLERREYEGSMSA